MAVHVKDIVSIMDLTWKVRQNGKRTIPCFSGPSGIGKSQGVHQWVDLMKSREGNFRMIDLRGATIDASDTRGLPWKDEKTGQTVFLPPDFLPTSGNGVLFIDEINRSSTPVMNCFMELFTEWRIGNYHLPKGWIIATAINPGDNEAYDVNTMDAALLNRVLKYDVKFDHKAFVAYAESKSWSRTVVSFLKSGQWIYKEPGTGDGFYISPRTWEEISDLELAGLFDNQELHSDVCIAALGKNVGNDYWNFCHKQKPVIYGDFEKEYKKLGSKKDKIQAMDTLKEFAAYAETGKAKSYRADLINATVQSILDFAKAKSGKTPGSVDPDLLEAICMRMPADQAAALIQGVAMTTPDPARWIQEYKANYKELFNRLRTTVVKEGTKTAGA